MPTRRVPIYRQSAATKRWRNNIRQRMKAKYANRPNRNAQLTVMKGVQNQVIPNRFKTKLIYNSYITIGDGTSAFVGNYIYRGNSIFDPDYTSTGGQPSHAKL